MLVTFTTKAYADIIMFGDVALSLLKMMGHSATVPSAILAADVPEALTRLKNALNAKEEQVSPQNADDGEAKISMRNRALPLIALLTAAAEQKADVMWT